MSVALGIGTPDQAASQTSPRANLLRQQPLHLTATLKWSPSCSFSGMITRFLLILAGLFAVGIVGAFLLYVSVLSLLAAMSVMIGLLATLVLGYWAGCNSLEQPPKSAKP
jgi:hypothetical protein